AFLDTLERAHGEWDMVGMSVYYYDYGIEYTPMRYLQDEVRDREARSDWWKINVASKPQRRDRWGNGGGRHYPAMPREYTSEYGEYWGWGSCNESGTDHHVGLKMAHEMFGEHPDPHAYRAMVVLTDGEPIQIRPYNKRVREDYDEDRWRWVRGDGSLPR